MIKIGKVESTLRGESPKSGIPTVVIEVIETGKPQKMDELIAVISQGNGEIVTITGKPFRQIKDLCKLISEVGNKNVIIETSGRLPSVDINRDELVPLVDKTTLVFKPHAEFLDDKNYGWMKDFRFSNSYYKFEWQGNDKDMMAHINKFFKITNINMLKASRQSRIIIVSKDIDDTASCREIWTFCMINEMRYSGRENRRLFK
jgi:hypothetical protein